MKFQTDTYLQVDDAEADVDGEWIDLRYCLGIAITVTSTDAAAGTVTLVASQDKENEVVIDSYTADPSMVIGGNQPDLFWPWVRFRYSGTTGTGTVTVKATIKGA